jgi:hypothetical protein
MFHPLGSVTSRLPCGYYSVLLSPCTWAYEASPSGLTIVFHLGSKQFGPVVRAGRVKKSTDRSIRLWGNGGLFAGTGIFWNGTWGIFRAYVANSDRISMVLVETQSGNVLVSRENPAEFMEVLNSIRR